jgi:hypothetical protein
MLRRVPGAAKDILDTPPPFGFKLESNDNAGSGYQEVSSDDLGGYAAMFRGTWTYRLTITAPAGQTILKARVRWVHIRASHGFKPSIDELFEKVTVPVVPGAKDLDIPASGKSQVTVEMTALASFKSKHIEPHHSYFWPHIELTTTGGSFAHDFKIVGVSYYG